MVPGTRHASRSSRLFSLHGKRPWTLVQFVEAIASSAACTIALHEWSAHASGFLDLFSSLDFPLDTYFIFDSTMSWKSSIE